jgi:hypothetical protein
MYKPHQILVLLALPLIFLAGCRMDRNRATDPDSPGSAYDGTARKGGPAEIFKDSVLIASGTYRNGKKTGLWTYYYPTGHIKAEGNYHNGLKDGMWVEWYKDGDVMWKGEWDKGKRSISFPKGEPHVRFADKGIEGNVLTGDSIYTLRIRVPNVPPEYLFIEASSGTIEQGEEPDLFTYRPGDDSTMTLVIGYYPDTEFKDFRNLVSEFEYRIE